MKFSEWGAKENEMSKSLRVVSGIAALALLLTAAAGLTWAEKPADSPSPEAVLKAMEEAAKPGPQHEKLQPLAGQWTYTAKMWMDPSQPPMESTGTIERDWILGGRFLEERFVGTCPISNSDWEGRGTIGFDKAQDKYTYTWVCTMGTATCTSLGTCDDAGKHFTFETEAYCPVRKKKVQGRDELRIESPDKHVLEVYQFDDGKEMKVMELTAVRKK